MKYREIGENFCKEINKILNDNKFNASFVTGGGYAYDSIKYKDNNINGDFDFMIIYDNYNTASNIISKLKNINFNFEDRYLDIDLKLLKSNKIDIIRLSGNYNSIKSTINLVPISLIKRICNFESEIIIKKIAHNRNTSLFFAYGSNNSRIVVNFISPSFITPDNEDHYVHLDFSFIKKDNNIYLGILADSILKGFNKDYDKLNFSTLRNTFLDNIHNFFKKNNIDSTCFINLFANNIYFPEYLRKQLNFEFQKRGKIVGKIIPTKNYEPILFTTKFETEYPKNSFNFINNKSFNMPLESYINKMQETEYDRQYLIDAIGKFFGYLLSSKNGEKNYPDDNIISKIDVYGTNDLYLKNASQYKIESIIDSFIRCLLKNKKNYNGELIKILLMISVKFMEQITKMNLNEILKKYNITNLFDKQLDNRKMNINTINSIKSFNEIGIYHNYTSKVMPIYTEKECKFLDLQFGGQKEKMILDIMCGYGRIANKLKNYGYKKIYGIDNETYDFLNINKDFNFINDDYLEHKFSQLFNFAYSLYNCYESKLNLYSIFNKTYSLLDTNGLFIMDCFNKSWRDQIDSNFEKILYKDNNYKLIIKREYNKSNGIEKTWYELYYKMKKIKEYDYSQKFFTNNDIIDVLDIKQWDCEILDSKKLQYRNNSQKHVLVLRKK